MFKNLNASALGVSGHQSEIIELALTYGFQGFDLDMEKFAARAKLRGMEYARRLIDSAKIRVGSFGLPLEWDVDDDQFKEKLTELAELAQVAAEIGCTRCLATISPAGDTRPYHENFEFHKHRFTDICQTLGSHGIRLGLGFLAAEEFRKGQAFQFIHDFEALSLLVNMIDLPNAGIVLDTWDLHVCGATVEDVRSLSAEKIVAVQLADLPADVTDLAEIRHSQRELPAVDGPAGIPAILTALAEIGFDGPLTLQPAKEALGGLRRDAVVERAGQDLDTVWKAAGLTPDGKLVAPPVPAES
jgi:sugar phosphate isomerase/epimerase